MGSSTQSPISVMRKFGSVKAEAIGAKGDGVANDTAAFALAKYNGIRLELSTGKTYLVDDVFSVGETYGYGRLKDANTIQTSSENKPVQTGNAPLVVDMHYGVLRGYGFAALETGGNYKIISVPVDIEAGASAFTVTDNAFITPNQLMVFLAEDGEYFTGVVDTVNGLDVNLKDSTAKKVLAGNNLFNFYSNGSHPTIKGYNAIVDYALNNASYCETFIREFRPASLSGGVVGVNASNSYANPASSLVDGWVVTASNVGDGAQFELGESLATGNYSLSIPLNVGQNNSLTIVVKSKNGGFDIFKNSALTTKDSGKVSVDFYVFKPDVYLVQIYTTVGSDAFFMGNATITKRINPVPQLNSGVHVCLGDSWFFQEGIVERLQERLTNAVIINKGVGGQIAQEMHGRFSTDVAVHRPDFVWLMTGTNEYGRSIDKDLTSFYINKIKAECVKIGAQLIIFNSSVGDVNASTVFFDKSRELANKAYLLDGYRNEELVGIGEYSEQIISIQSTTVAAGESVYFGFIGIKDKKTIVIKEHFFTDNCAFIQTDNVNYQAGVDEVIKDLTSGYSATEKTAVTTANRWACLKYTNNSGAEKVFQGYVKASVEL